VITPSDVPPVLAMCAGYDERTWRAKELAQHLCKWIPEWALRYGEWDNLQSGTMMEMIRRAALKVYTTEQYASRGEFGELMLHAIIRHEFGTEPAISKIYFKDAANDTVKGFDCVHVTEAADGSLELWLGEAKFYALPGQAVTSAATDLVEHLERDYLRTEFAFICDKLDDSFPLSSKLREMLDSEQPLDGIVSALRLPVMLAFNSQAVASYDEVCDEYCAALEEEAIRVRAALLKRLEEKPMPRKVAIDLVLLPVDNKKVLLDNLDRELRLWQGRT
jgi:hypothetical protein